MLSKYFKNKKGTTFIELLFYIAIFLGLTVVLLTVSIYAIRQDSQYNVEKQVNADSHFMAERIYDLIAGAKRIDVASSVFHDPEGKLTLVMQDDSIVVIENNSDTERVEITEDGVVSDLSTGSLRVESLYFEGIPNNLNDPEILTGVTTLFDMSGFEEYGVTQGYVTSANLERGDYDGDGCLDFMDEFPRHAECCGDSEADGICDEMDNCIMVYNPFQEDFDGDGIGDECDGSIFFDGPGDEDESSGYGLTAFNCQISDYLVDLINHNPPISPGELKQILTASSPLSPEVLQAMIDVDPALPPGIFKIVFAYNAKLPDEVYESMLEMDLPGGIKNQLIQAQEEAEDYAWQGEGPMEIIYDVDIAEELHSIFFDDAETTEGQDAPLGENETKKTDVFLIKVSGGTDSVTVTTQTFGGSSVDVLTGAASGGVNSIGFAVILEEIVGDTYAFTISSVSNTEPLESVEFHFGETATVLEPPEPEYGTFRYTYYCPGGCAEDCGDYGTGINTGLITDICYRWDDTYPEWCSRWNTFIDDDSENPAYFGGTQEGEEDLYWEKSFKTILSKGQIAAIQSITVGGEIAYQSTTPFFCDILEASCPINGVLVGDQDVELYNWDTESWEGIGTLDTDDTESDQQDFEVLYDGADPQRFIGGDNKRVIKARMQFNWDGIPPEGSDSAPSFMLIDYFTLHLKW